MRTVSSLCTFTALALLGCGARGGAPATAPDDATPDAAVPDVMAQPQDVAPAADVAAPDVVAPDVTTLDGAAPDATASDAPTPQDVAPPPDVVAPGRMYPPGPYGSRVCARLEPFTLDQCDGTPWSFADSGFHDNDATLLIISAGWCVPCQREAVVLEREIVQPYRGRRVRIVQVMVQNPDRTAVTPAFCQQWVDRYRLTIPELMDPHQVLSPFYPGLAFPGNLIVDRGARIRWRQYGTEMSLASIRAALDDVLADPDNCTP